MYLNETYIEVHIGKNVSGSFPLQNGLKQGDTLSPLFFTIALDSAIGKDWYGMEHISFLFILMMLMCWAKTQIP
jgi:hypothetical protein